MKALRVMAVMATFPLFIATGCGGGGGGDNAVTPPASPVTEVNTYGDTNLPGHLVVMAGSGPATVYDLRTGQGTLLSASPTGGNSWTGSTDKSTILRVSGGGPNGEDVLERIRTSDWTRQGAPTLIAGTFHRPKVSPDGKYILTFWEGADENRSRLTIFDTATGAIIKRGSKLDDKIVISSPAAWLPDGRYIYLAGNRSYAASPTAPDEVLLGTLDLPLNSVFEDETDSTGTQLAVSPDGRKITFDWSERRSPGGTSDLHIWVANIDGTGLHRLTSPPDTTTALSFTFGNATWSPDSKWVAAVVYMNGSIVAPIFPPDQSFPGVPGGIIGSTGCSTNPVFVLPVDAVKVPISWPRYDVLHGLKVRNSSGNGGMWVSTCASVHWVN